MTRGRRAGIAMALAGFAYCFIAPLFWPSPRVTVDMASDLRLGSDAALRLTIHAWHHFEVWQVIFYPLTATVAEGVARTAPPGTTRLAPLTLYFNDAESLITAYSRAALLGRLTWPRSRTLDLTVPLRELEQQDAIGPGLLTARLAVDVRHLDVLGAPRGVTRARVARLEAPINVRLAP